MRVIFGFLLYVFLATADAQTGVMHIIVPFGAGGVQDILARAISSELGAALGKSVIVENRPGAGGTIGTAYVARSAPDGNTLVLSAASHTIAGSLYAKLPYDPIADFTGVAHIGTIDYVLMANADVKAASVKGFVALLKANPGRFNYASAGNGSATHLSMAYFNGLAGTEMVHIPYKSTGEAVQEVLAGRAQAVISGTIGAIPFAKDPRVRLLGVTGEKRSKFLPDLPTIGETLPGYVFDSWLGLLGPKAMPRRTAEEIDAAMHKLLKDPAILGRLAKQGVEPKALGVDEFDALLKADFQKMARVVKASGARID
jgi:tripartite-type tricarboxylate transporter receptor subunit TctC